MISELANLLSSNNYLDVSNISNNPDLDMLAQYKFHEMKRNKNPRSLKTLYRDIRKSLITEIGIAKLIAGKPNPNFIHDVSDPETYIYDILGPEGERIEIKCLSRDDAYVRFNLESSNKPLEYPASRAPWLDTFIKNCENLDYIIFCSLSNDILTVKYIINSKTFKNYVGLSEASYAPTHWYHNKWAIKAGDCFKLF